MTLLHFTVYASLFIQIITGIIDYIALQIQVPLNVIILQQTLLLELIVQIIEGIFYIWLVLAIQRKDINVTPKRYWDWALTTPMMLFSLMVYLEYINENKDDKSQSVYEFYQKHRNTVLTVVVLNASMLLFGYLGEIGIIPNHIAVFIGFIPFIAYFYIIYQNFVKNNTGNVWIYWYFLFFWSIYGIAALFPYNLKNTTFNILDLFAKNFFGLFLAYILYQSRVKKE